MKVRGQIARIERVGWAFNLAQGCSTEVAVSNAQHDWYNFKPGYMKKTYTFQPTKKRGASTGIVAISSSDASYYLDSELSLKLVKTSCL